MEAPPYLAQLNEQQRQAVLHTGRPLLILAGAGSGKTRVITSKIVYLIRELGVPPQAILAVTFTNKAAKEMAERACGIDERAAAVMTRTFHSFGAWFLRRYASGGDLARNFTIYDDDASCTLTSSIMGGAKSADAKKMARDIALAKDYFYTPDSPELSLVNHTREFQAVYAEYEKRLARSGNVDFGDLIKKPAEMLKNDARLAAYVRDRFRIILVDEYQDANVAQFELLRALYGDETYLCVVGDDDQSIYRFRGAEVRNILRFSEQFGGADQIKLERNYRSKQEILSLAGSVIARNKGRLGKTLSAERGSGKLPCLIYVEDQEREARLCADMILRSTRDGAKFSDWAVLYRVNAQSIGFESEFLHRAVPYRVIGSLKFYEREEIKDALCLLAFLVNPRDVVAFRRMVNKPARGIGKTSIDKIIAFCAAAAEGAAAAEAGVPEEERWNLEAAAEKTAGTLSAKARQGLAVFLAAIKNARALLTTAGEAGTPAGAGEAAADGVAAVRASEGLAVCLAALLNDSGIAEYHQKNDVVEGETRLANLQQLANNAVLFPPTREGLVAFLDQIELDKSLDTAEDENIDDRVSLITLHNTKGMEFRRVVISACEQGIFPRSGKQGEDLEEERRLFYVGATRAMDELYFTCAFQRRLYGQLSFQQPSVFLQEADSTFLETRGLAPAAMRGAFSYRFAPARANAPTTAHAPPPRAPACSSDGRWTLGDRVFHDDEGYGEISGITEGDDGPVIEARFETGRTRRFLSESQSRAYMKIKE
ncbi:MAG: ATP-dependent helicase [Spirochaetaceae bacterium]|jgi:DNA helicase-2/ATP-dependent DNA helicase PcrA|nr:ATP-dependent helicase [Spirochaetaceae bacterium]